jgi:hypothetical protein
MVYPGAYCAAANAVCQCARVFTGAIAGVGGLCWGPQHVVLSYSLSVDRAEVVFSLYHRSSVLLRPIGIATHRASYTLKTYISP